MSETSERITAEITRVWNETPTLTGVEFRVDDEVAAAYQRPGQYVVIHLGPDEKPLFMALASAPGNPAFELLCGAAATERLAPAVGGTIEMDPPGGKGYPVEIAADKDVLLFSVGSGASAIRSMIEHLRANRGGFQTVHLFHGAHTEEEHAYRALDDAWSADGISIHRAVGKPWVQDVFRAREIDVANAVAFVCGMKSMVAGVTEALVDAGMSADDVRQNF